jgi:hypothetical protein
MCNGLLSTDAVRTLTQSLTQSTRAFAVGMFRRTSATPPDGQGMENAVAVPPRIKEGQD